MSAADVAPTGDDQVTAGGGVLAVDLGATHLRAALAPTAGARLSPVMVRRTADLRRGAADDDRADRADQDGVGREAVVPAIARALRDTIDAGIRVGLPAPSAIGIGLAAFVDPAGSLIAATPYGVPAGTRLRDGLEQALGLPVVVDNDAKVAALGELEHGAGRSVADFVLVTLGTNIGGAVVHGRRVVRGAHGIAGEVGMILAGADRGPGADDPVAHAGRFGRAVTKAPAGYAYLEDLVGGAALAQRADAGTSLFAACAAGDPLARTVVTEAVEGWAVLVADLAVILDPGLVILSGGLVAEAAHFIEPLRRRVSELTAFAPEIRIGELGASAGLVGAAVAARRVAGTREARQPEAARSANPRIAHDLGAREGSAHMEGAQR